MWSGRRALGLLVIGALASAACGASSDEGSKDDDIRNVERVIIGKAKPYSPDRTLDSKIDLLTKSQKARRDVAWKAIAKVLKDARLAETEVEVDDRKPKLPAFRTWYQKDDVERMFARLYEQHGKEARQARKPFTTSQIEAVVEWNANDRGSWSEEQYFERVKQAGTAAQVQGLSGNSRVSYSPGMVRHMLTRYGTLTKC